MVLQTIAVTNNIVDTATINLRVVNIKHVIIIIDFFLMLLFQNNNSNNKTKIKIKREWLNAQPYSSSLNKNLNTVTL